MTDEIITSSEDYSSVMDEVWGDDSTAETTAETEPETESTGEVTETEAEADQPADGTEAEAGAEGGAEDEAEPEADGQTDEGYTLKHMDEVKTVGREEVISLAQKGMDYDRIRGKLDALTAESKPREERLAELEKHEAVLKRLGEGSSRTIEQILEQAELAMLISDSKEKGIELSEAGAREKLSFRREKEAFEAEKSAAKAAEAEPKEEEKPDPVTERNQAEFVAFAQDYPDVKAEDIPQEVWDEFAQGKSLSSAYARFENKQLRAKVKTLEQNQKNRARSTGSQKSAGASSFDASLDAIWK